MSNFNRNLRYDSLNSTATESPVDVPVQHVVAPHFLEKHLPNRYWRSMIRNEVQQPFFKIHLVSYNILAQRLMMDNRYLYDQCFPINLQGNRRRERLLNELMRQNADIICLQEMQADHFHNEFRPRLAQFGYEAIYVKRNGEKPDGCCLFYKFDRLRLIDSRILSFYQPNVPMLEKDNCALMALFQPISRQASSSDLFCVGTTHLLFSPTRGDIKLAQLQYFLAEIDQFACDKNDPNSHYPILLCGDFNAVPHSPLLDFLLKGEIQYDQFHSSQISGQLSQSQLRNRAMFSIASNGLLPSNFVTLDCRFAAPSSSSSTQQFSAILTHNKPLLSVYDETQVTSNVNNQPHLVDYIFYTKSAEDSGRLRLLSRYELYRTDQMSDIHLPNHQFPSDHFLLAAKFALHFVKTR